MLTGFIGFSVEFPQFSFKFLCNPFVAFGNGTVHIKRRMLTDTQVKILYLLLVLLIAEFFDFSLYFLNLNTN